MFNERQIELIIERLVNRITQGNSFILKKIGKNLNKIKNVDDDKIYELQQELLYGNDLNEIIEKINKITALNIKDIETIFMEVARKNQQFAKKYYDYKGIETTPLDENESLKQVVKSYSDEVIGEYQDISNNMGYTLFNTFDILMFLPLAIAYQEAINYAILKRSLGKQQFIQEIELQVKKLAKSGLKSYDYDNNKTYRIDNSLKMQMQQGIRDMTNDLQQRFGEEYGANGIEVSVHEYPAPDHAEVQGHQFTKEEFEKFQNDMDATDINGVIFPAEFEGHDRRSIGEYNCYHYVFYVLLGIDEPQYTHEDLSEIVKQNDNGFFFEGKHYTMYEGTQLQNRIEREIQQQEDTKQLAKDIGDKDLEMQSRKKIVDLSSKYKELSNISGLPTKMDKMKEWGYKKLSIDDIDTNIFKINKNDFTKFSINAPIQDFPKIGKEHFNFPSNSYLDSYVGRGQKMFEHMEKDINYRNAVYKEAKEIDDLKRPVDDNYILFSGQKKNMDLTKTDLVISTSIDKKTAKFYAMEKDDIVNTIYVEKGANLISTVNTKRKQFDLQGELIIPISELKNLIKLDDYIYLLKK